MGSGDGALLAAADEDSVGTLIGAAVGSGDGALLAAADGHSVGTLIGASVGFVCGGRLTVRSGDTGAPVASTTPQPTLRLQILQMSTIKWLQMTQHTDH